ncbi:hypothetical protein NQ315_001418 [Exocentrus adspersus]|uniref:Fibronectin type-III domain-containing protein n=1 Tax=Exocentrus adspersus TaxID=1586481 RepID=A0AAV8WF70_9CUCU|nr:hypothetical protein NQ315_001418 [Exocentrus adspersus]
MIAMLNSLMEASLKCISFLVPSAVDNFVMHANANLTWETHPDETCEIDSYWLDLKSLSSKDQHHFAVKENYIHLTFLAICDEWEVVVRALSNNTYGYERRTVTHIPLPPNADLALGYFNGTLVDPRILLLHWQLRNHTHGDCTLRYRVTVTNEDDSLIRDNYENGYFALLNDLSPCVSYSIGVRAVNIAHPTIEGPLSTMEIEIPPQPQAAPLLKEVTAGATSIRIVWEVEGYYSQRCPVRSLHVDGGSHFNIEIPVNSTTERPPVEMELKGLKPNSMYFLKVSVENMGGLSPPAQIAVQTLELEPSSG